VKREQAVAALELARDTVIDRARPASVLFNNSEHGRNGPLRAGRAIIEGDVASSRRRSL
jgi:hypothetical protein